MSELNFQNEQQIIELTNKKCPKPKSGSDCERCKLLEGLIKQIGLELIKSRQDNIKIVQTNVTLAERIDGLASQLDQSKSLNNKLESLCKTLQERYKASEEKYKKDISLETQRRTEIQQKFETSFQELASKIKDEEEKRLQCIKNNEETQKKIETVVKGQELKEQQQLTTIKKLELEKEMANTKLEQHINISNQLIDKAKLMQEQLEQSQKREEILKEQLKTYSDKYGEITELITKNKDALTEYQKQIKQLTIENNNLKEKSVKSDKLLIENELNKRDQANQIVQLTKQIETLKRLCSTLQEERKKLKEDLTNGVKPAEGEDSANDKPENTENPKETVSS